MKAKQVHYCFKQQAESNVHKLYIYDDVEEHGDWNWETWNWDESETSAKHFRDVLEEIPETATIELHINSNGGSVKEGVAIYNLLKQKKCKEIVAYVDGFAFSVASVILQAADRRIMGVGTSLLIHNMWIYVAGNANDLRKAADDLDVLMEANRQIYLERATISEEELIEMMNNETYITPEQAVEMGFADEVNSKKEANANDAMQAMQQQLQQMRREMAQQKSFRTELLEFCKGAMQKDDDNDNDDNNDGNDNGTDDEENNEDKDQKDPQESKNKSSIAQLLARAAAKNLKG